MDRLLTLVAAMALAACGGGGDDGLPLRTPPAITAVVAPPPPARVAFEGCVVDPNFIPRTGTPVRALAADGRLLANAISDQRGEFRLNLPALQSLSIAIDKPDGEAVRIATGRTKGSLRNCLLDPTA